MAENDNQKKKNEYEVGFGGTFLGDFSAFDSIENAPSEKDVKVDTPTEIEDIEAYQEETEQIPEISDSDNETEKSLKDKKQKSNEKKNPAFAIICSLLVVAIIACSTLSVLSIKKFMTSSAEVVEVVDAKAYNEFSEMVAKYGTTTYPKGILKNVSRAYATNTDTVGWLYINGTNINTPVVQCKNNSYYLRYNFYKKHTTYGTTYADYRCNIGSLSKNTVIYGHNMPSGTHFYDVNRYEDIEWYKLHPVITYTTLYETYTFLIYTAFYTTVDSKDDGGYIFNYIYPNMSENNFKGYMEQVNQRALYTTAVDLKSTDKVITLSTCNHTYDKLCGRDVDSRLVVLGRLLRSGESADVNTSSAKENSNYRRPQIWYDIKGKTNPYASSRTWKPASN